MSILTFAVHNSIEYPSLFSEIYLDMVESHIGCAGDQATLNLLLIPVKERT